jgi:hypothetical protein
MKRVMIRPGKSVLVSDEAFSRARDALQVFGVDADAFKRLGDFTGDVTIGANAVAAKAVKASKAKKVPAKTAQRTRFKIFRSRISEAAKAIQAGTPMQSRPVVEVAFGDPPTDRGRKLKIVA